MTITSGAHGRLRRLAVLAATLLLVSISITPAIAQGGDHGVCGDGYWIKFDWQGGTWVPETGPAWNGDEPDLPTLEITAYEDGDPMEVDWTSSEPVLSVHTKSGLEYDPFPGGTSGTVTGHDPYAISFIVFCYGEPPPPNTVTVIKVVEGEDGGADYVFELACEPADGVLEPIGADGLAATFSLADGESEVLDLPRGVGPTLDCELAETETNDADEVTAHLGDVLLEGSASGWAFEIPTDADSVITVTNTFEELPPPELTASIALVKEALITPDDDGDKVVEFDAEAPAPEIDYLYTVTNTGEVTLVDLELEDDVLGDITLAATTLLPGASTTGTATYTVTAADADAGQVANVAVVTGQPDVDGMDPVTATDDEIVLVLVTEVLPEVLLVPDIALTKTALIEPDGDGDKVARFDPDDPDEVVYEYVITNTGESLLTALTLVDDVLGTLTVPVASLAPGASVTVTAPYVLTAADADAGEVVNTATTTGTDPDGVVVEATDTETVLVAEVLDVVLPVTGRDLGGLAALAAILVSAGAALVVSDRRRTARSRG